MTYVDRLHAAVRRVGNPCLLGIDPHPDLLPDEYALVRDERAPRSERARAMGDFACELVDVAAGRVAAVKPQSAFFELFGADGAREWERVVGTARDAGLFVIGDVKRGDIASTAAAYARAHLEGPAACDAITVNPYLGSDSIEPFLAVCERTGAGLYVLVRTSNPGSAEFQHHGEPDLSHVVARAVARWGERLRGRDGWSSVGAVIGATHPSELAGFRRAMPRTPILLPGYGAQGGGVEGLLAAFQDGWLGGLINASRSIAFAGAAPEHAGRPWKDAAREALGRMIDEVTAALPASR